MPTIDRIGGHQIGFYSNDATEPPHVPVRLERARGFAPHELNWIRRIIEVRATGYLEAWNDYFSR